MEKQLDDLKKTLAELDKKVLAQGVKHKHHGNSPALIAARARLTGAVEMLEAHAAWLKENPEPAEKAKG